MKAIALSLLLALSCTLLAPASAQVGIGPYLGAEIGRMNVFTGIAARYDVGRFQLAPSVEASFMRRNHDDEQHDGTFEPAPSVGASFADDFSHWQLNADVLYRLNVREALLQPYLGAGFTVRNTPGFHVSPGASAMAGVGLNLGLVVPFVQTRLTVAGSTNLTLMGGLVVTPPFRRK